MIVNAESTFLEALPECEGVRYTVTNDLFLWAWRKREAGDQPLFVVEGTHGRPDAHIGFSAPSKDGNVTFGYMRLGDLLHQPPSAEVAELSKTTPQEIMLQLHRKNWQWLSATLSAEGFFAGEAGDLPAIDELLFDDAPLEEWDNKGDMGIPKPKRNPEDVLKRLAVDQRKTHYTYTNDHDLSVAGDRKVASVKVTVEHTMDNGEVFTASFQMDTDDFHLEQHRPVKLVPSADPEAPCRLVPQDHLHTLSISGRVVKDKVPEDKEG